MPPGRRRCVVQATPACAGRSRATAIRPSVVRATPACAGKVVPPPSKPVSFEPPPRVRGKSCHRHQSQCRSSHPRVCGEKSVPPPSEPVSFGPPPRVRGQVVLPGRRRCRARSAPPVRAIHHWRQAQRPTWSTPALAGNPTLASSPVTHVVHPRTCGEFILHARRRRLPFVALLVRRSRPSRSPRDAPHPRAYGGTRPCATRVPRYTVRQPRCRKTVNLRAASPFSRQTVTAQRQTPRSSTSESLRQRGTLCHSCPTARSIPQALRRSQPSGFSAVLSSSLTVQWLTPRSPTPESLRRHGGQCHSSQS